MASQFETKTLKVIYPSGSYDISFGSNLLAKVQGLAQIKENFVVISDTNVSPLYADQVNGAAAVITIPAGEQYKTLDTTKWVYDELLKLRLDRRGTLVALGGGVVGDLAGFVAATYLRGVEFVQCPTSLLAMVDASVGGKTGVDMPQGKNLVGAFKQPKAVIADIETLKTLPSAEFAAGMAELIKHGLIDDVSLFEILEGIKTTFTASEWDKITLTSLIAQAVEVKIGIVEEDPYENGRRATLNLGHTFGHVIEHASNYQIRHGEGVAMGLVAAANLSSRLGYCHSDLQVRIESVLQKAGLPIRIPSNFSAENLYDMMFSDKKVASRQLRFILIANVGEVFIQSGVPKTAVLETIRELQH